MSLIKSIGGKKVNFDFNKNFISTFIEKIDSSDLQFINQTLKELHPSDVANLIENLPGVHHYSWFDLERKIHTYKNYWSQHWQSLYNIPQEDTEENNMFFDKAWADVSEDELDAQADKLSSELGGWIFHKKVD